MIINKPLCQKPQIENNTKNKKQNQNFKKSQNTKFTFYQNIKINKIKKQNTKS